MKNDMTSADSLHTSTSISSNPATIHNNSTINIHDNTIKSTNSIIPNTTSTTPHTPSHTTLNMLSSSHPKQGTIVDATTDKSNIFLKRHAAEYSTYISLQFKKLHKKFYVSHPLYGAEYAIANTFHSARENIDNPYSDFFARQALVTSLEALTAQTDLTNKTLTHLRSYDDSPTRPVSVPTPPAQTDITLPAFMTSFTLQLTSKIMIAQLHPLKIC